MNSPTSESLKDLLRALLFGAGQPLTLKVLSEVLLVSPKEIEKALKELQIQMQSDSVLMLHETRSGWRFSIRSPFMTYLHQLTAEKPIKLSKSSLEILSIIAYHQPITRSEIEKIRGVSTNPAAIKQLFEWQWIESAGHKDVPGKPELLKTSMQFCDDFGLKSLKELPIVQKIPLSDEF